MRPRHYNIEVGTLSVQLQTDLENRWSVFIDRSADMISAPCSVCDCIRGLLYWGQASTTLREKCVYENAACCCSSIATHRVPHTPLDKIVNASLICWCRPPADRPTSADDRRAATASCIVVPDWPIYCIGLHASRCSIVVARRRSSGLSVACKPAQLRATTDLI